MNVRIKLSWLFALATLAAFAPAEAFASTGGSTMPWDAPLSALIDNLSGPVAHYCVIGVLVITGIYWATTEHARGVNWMLKCAFGGAIAVGAVDLANVLGISGALC